MQNIEFLNQNVTNNSEEYKANEAKAIEAGIIKRIINDKLSYYTSGNISIAKNKYEQFRIDGVITLDVFHPSELPAIRDDMIKTIREFPEYNHNLDQPLIPVLGGFGALGNPASFHNPFVRSIRMRCSDVAFEVLDKVIDNTINPRVKKSYSKVALYDRMMWRRAGQEPMPESWHRDVMKKEQINDNDMIYGGWVNLDPVNSQFFSCVLGSHLGQNSYHLKDGFATIKELVNNKDEFDRVTADKSRIEIKPGQMIIFPQFIIHEVVAKGVHYDMYRVFTSWALLTGDKSIYVDKNGVDQLSNIMEEQAVPQLPGGMIPPIYSGNHLRLFQDKPFTIVPKDERTRMDLVTYSTTFFKPVCLIKRKKDDKFLVTRHMKSLKQLGLPLYKPYSEEEAKLYKPCKK